MYSLVMAASFLSIVTILYAQNEAIHFLQRLMNSTYSGHFLLLVGSWFP